MKRFLRAFTLAFVLASISAPSHGSERLKTEDLEIGKGVAVKPGMGVSIHYKAQVEGGKELFDSRQPPSLPVGFVIGVKERAVITGLAKGLEGMKAGGRRKITVPPELGYGKNGSADGVIPPNATIVFEVELLGIQEKPNRRAVVQPGQ